ncbi:MAG TPA: Gldg family protein, partial [Gammaproteobacteria bacterium]
NPEYDLTEAIKKVLYAYRASGKLFNNIEQPVHFKGYISPDEKLPEELVSLKKSLNEILAEYKKQAGDKLTVEIVDPAAGDGQLAQQLTADYGFRPLSTSLLSKDSFWFYLLMESNGRLVQVPLPEGLNKSGLEQGVEAAFKRFSKGFLKTIALHTPIETNMQGMPTPGTTKQFNWLRGGLEEEYNVVTADLLNGHVPQNADILVLLAPDSLDEKQLFAVDQFLMQGGTVIAATSPYDVAMSQTLAAHKHKSGLEDWLKHHGVSIEEKMVMDPQNSAFPIPVQRRVGGFVVQETRMINYPYFVDVRSDGLNHDSGVTSGINQVTVNWASPITVDQEKNQSRTVTPLLHSSENAWTSMSFEVQPDLNNDSGGFVAAPPEGRQLLGVAVEGSFESFFKGKPSPLVPETAEDGNEEEVASSSPGITRVVEKSPEAARIVLFASNTFLTDELLSTASRALGTQYYNPLQLAKNAIDWSLEDRALLSIRGRAHFSRTLEPLGKDAQMFWEYLNYGLALLGLVAVWLIRRQIIKRTRNRYEAVLAG